MRLDIQKNKLNSAVHLQSNAVQALLLTGRVMFQTEKSNNKEATILQGQTLIQLFVDDDYVIVLQNSVVEINDFMLNVIKNLQNVLFQYSLYMFEEFCCMM